MSSGAASSTDRPLARGAVTLALALFTTLLATSSFAQEPEEDGGWEIGAGPEAPDDDAAPGAEEAAEATASADGVEVEGEGGPTPPPAAPPDAEIVLVPVPGMAPPPGFVEDKYANEKFLVSGLLLTLGGQLGSIALSAALFDESEVPGEVFALGFLPIAGPFALTAYEHVPTFARPLYALIGTAQVTGLALDFAAGFSPQRLWKRAPSASRPAPYQVKAGPTGVSVSGSF